MSKRVASLFTGPMAEPLSDQDINDPAAFYSSLDQCK